MADLEFLCRDLAEALYASAMMHGLEVEDGAPWECEIVGTLNRCSQLVVYSHRDPEGAVWHFVVEGGDDCSLEDSCGPYQDLLPELQDLLGTTGTLDLDGDYWVAITRSWVDAPTTFGSQWELTDMPRPKRITLDKGTATEVAGAFEEERAN